MKSQFPQVIQSILARLETFILTSCLYGRAHIWRAMRPERQKSILTLLFVLAKSCCLAYDGAFVRVVNNGVAYPLTIKEMARLSGLPIWTVNRCLADLRELGFIKNMNKQIKRIGADGLECSCVLRCFTRAFYEAIGLYSMFVESVKWAAQHSKLKISWAFHKVKDKAAKAITKALHGAGASKVPKDEKERYRQKENAKFLEYLSCSAKHPVGCLGGYSSAEVCEVCRKFRSRGEA